MLLHRRVLQYYNSDHPAMHVNQLVVFGYPPPTTTVHLFPPVLSQTDFPSFQRKCERQSPSDTEADWYYSILSDISWASRPCLPLAPRYVPLTECLQKAEESLVPSLQDKSPLATKEERNFLSGPISKHVRRMSQGTLAWGA